MTPPLKYKSPVEAKGLAAETPLRKLPTEVELYAMVVPVVEPVVPVPVVLVVPVVVPVVPVVLVPVVPVIVVVVLVAGVPNALSEAA